MMTATAIAISIFVLVSRFMAIPPLGWPYYRKLMLRYNVFPVRIPLKIKIPHEYFLTQF